MQVWACITAKNVLWFRRTLSVQFFQLISLNCATALRKTCLHADKRSNVCFSTWIKYTTWTQLWQLVTSAIISSWGNYVHSNQAHLEHHEKGFKAFETLQPNVYYVYCYLKMVWKRGDFGEKGGFTAVFHSKTVINSSLNCEYTVPYSVLISCSILTNYCSSAKWYCKHYWHDWCYEIHWIHLHSPSFKPCRRFCWAICISRTTRELILGNRLLKNFLISFLKHICQLAN